MTNIVKKENFPKTQKELNNRKNIWFLLLPTFGGVGLYLAQSEILGYFLSWSLAILSFVFMGATVIGLTNLPRWNKIFENTKCQKCGTNIPYHDKISISVLKQSEIFNKDDESKDKIMRKVFTIKVDTDCPKCKHNVTFVDKTASKWMFPPVTTEKKSEKIDEEELKEAVKAYFAQELRL